MLMVFRRHRHWCDNNIKRDTWVTLCTGLMWLRIKTRVAGFCTYSSQSSSFVQEGDFPDYLCDLVWYSPLPEMRVTHRMVWALVLRTFIWSWRRTRVTGPKLETLRACGFVALLWRQINSEAATYDMPTQQILKLTRDNQISANIS